VVSASVVPLFLENVEELRFLSVINPLPPFLLLKVLLEEKVLILVPSSKLSPSINCTELLSSSLLWGVVASILTTF
jgi:hypothetical protein